ncbi:MAG TPA: hypothetical protein VFB66_00070 [Tepidisphaeraceae bacterium]|nr:hypothetical protein [Tepidisphaeraceae bacterium]
MRPARSILVCLLAFSAGCAAGDGAVWKDMSVSRVRAELGRPDVIGEESGDEARFYVPHNPPEHAWPAGAVRTFYYLDRNVAVTFERGRVVSTAPIDPRRRQSVLLPLIASNRGGSGDGR